MTNNLIIPIFIPHQGCPHTCVFCNQRKIAGSFQIPTAREIEKTVLSYRDSFTNITEAYIELAFYGGSFTGIDVDLQEELLLAVWNLKDAGLIHGTRLSTRPDYIDSKILRRLMDYGVSTVELGVQSLAPDVLVFSQRGHSADQVFEAVTLLKKTPIKVGIQLMPGLPKDSLEKVIMTTNKVIKLKPDFVRIYPTVVIKETILANLFSLGQYQPWTLEMTIEVVAKMVILFTKANIPIIRMGLQATDNLVVGEDLVGGPYHPAFGELVKSRVFRKQIEYLLEENQALQKNNNLTLFVNPMDLSQVKGQKKVNILYFKEQYNLNLILLTQDSLDPGSLAWHKNSALQVLSRREFIQ